MINLFFAFFLLKAKSINDEENENNKSLIEEKLKADTNKFKDHIEKKIKTEEKPKKDQNTRDKKQEYVIHIPVEEEIRKEIELKNEENNNETESKSSKKKVIESKPEHNFNLSEIAEDELESFSDIVPGETERTRKSRLFRGIVSILLVISGTIILGILFAQKYNGMKE
jgi:hypothetical protein